MSNLIASDDNNTQFVGAHDPDARLHVVFYEKEMQDAYRSEKEGRPIFFMVDKVKITVPGNQLNNMDDFVNDSHKQRFPRQWQHYLNNKKADSEAIIGTPLAEWPRISRAQAEELKYLGFRSVENIANASDAQLQSLGMKAGMQPHAFRELAQRFLATANQEAAANKDAERAAAAEAREAETAKALAEMREQLAALQAKGKPGRKPKVTEAA